MKKKIFIVFLALILAFAAVEAGFAATLKNPYISAEQTKDTSVTLSWKRIIGSDGYEVYRKESGDKYYKKIKTITSSYTKSYTSTDLTTGKTYYFKLRAYDKAGSKIVQDSFSKARAVKVTRMKPNFIVYLPTTMNKTTKTIIVSITNDSTGSNMYIEGSAVFEDLSDDGKAYTAKVTSYSKPDSGRSGTLKEGLRLLLYPGEKVRLTYQLNDTFSYDRSKVRLTTEFLYKSHNWVSVYSTKEKNRIYTPKDYYQYLTGGK